MRVAGVLMVSAEARLRRERETRTEELVPRIFRDVVGRAGPCDW
jgi:hypothetical protein